MDDNLEKFVKDNRHQFDSEEPDATVWEGIQYKLLDNQTKERKLLIWRAAAVLFFISSIGLMLYISNATLKQPQIVENNEFKNTEVYYSNLISERQQLVKATAANYPDVVADFEQDWYRLAKEYIELKQEYSKYGNDEVLNALIKNLQAQAHLLNKQLDILKSIKAEQTEQKITI